jgi:hypothetical protein
VTDERRTDIVRKQSILHGLLLLAALSSVAACDGPDVGGGRRGSPSTGNPSSDGEGEEQQACTTRGREYVGFGDTALTRGRVEAPAGADRARVKPIEAIRGEIARLLDQEPPSLGSAAASFGGSTDRWHQEPTMSAIAITAAYRVAFEACLAHTASSPSFAEAPTPASATKACTTFTRSFWSRTAEDDELAACVSVALEDSAGEPDPRRRWAYTCAAVLSSAGFLTY